MRFQIGDLVQHEIYGSGTVLDAHRIDSTLLVEFVNIVLWVNADECRHDCETHRFALDEPPNFSGRLAWWRELMPMWSGVPRKLGCTPEILVSTFVAWDCELTRIDASAVTVEADGEGCLVARDIDWIEWYGTEFCDLYSAVCFIDGVCHCLYDEIPSRIDTCEVTL